MSEIDTFIQDYVNHIAKPLVDYQDDIEVTAILTTTTILIQIKTHPDDLGKIIGKKGKNVMSIKLLARAAKNTEFVDDNRNVNIEIIEPKNSSFSH